jgi:predicted NAD/FAD-dependent oxidoreductase
MSSVNKNYSPKGKQLWAVNLLSPNEDTSVKEVERELTDWFPDKKLTHIKRYTIRKSLPNSPQYGQREIKINGTYQCGDHMQDPSIDGALKSGRLVAERILSGTD